MSMRSLLVPLCMGWMCLACDVTAGISDNPPASSPGAGTPSPTPERLAAAAQLVEAMRLEEVLRQQTRVACRALMAPMSEKLWRMGNPSVAAEMESYFTNWTAKIESRVVRQSVIDQTARAAAQTFSPEELEELTAFYKSPLGGRLARQLPAILEPVVQEDVVPVLEHSPRLFQKIFEDRMELAMENLLAKQRAQAGIAPGRIFPNIVVPCADGSTFTLSALKGKTVLLVFWSSDSPEWARQLPLLRDIHHRYRARGLQIATFNLDFNQPDEARKHLASQPLPWPVMLGRTEPGVIVCRTLAPAADGNFLISPDGKLAAMDVSDANLLKAVEAAMKQQPVTTGTP